MVCHHDQEQRGLWRGGDSMIYSHSLPFAKGMRHIAQTHGTGLPGDGFIVPVKGHSGVMRHDLYQPCLCEELPAIPEQPSTNTPKRRIKRRWL